MPLQWMGGTYSVNPKKDQPQLLMPTTERQGRPLSGTVSRPA